MATYQEAHDFIEGRFYTVRARHGDQAARTITSSELRELAEGGTITQEDAARLRAELDDIPGF